MVTLKAIYWGVKILKIVFKPTPPTFPEPEETCFDIDDVIDVIL